MASATNRSPSPRPAGYPEPLRRTAAGHWGGTARATLGYAKANHAPWGRLTETAGALPLRLPRRPTRSSRLAARGEWITNEKRLLERAGLREFDEVAGRLRATPDALVAAVARAEEIVAGALPATRRTSPS
ncbi:hypothetical protein [Streptomyces sp. WP-1]|uniref:hypothetical protein n=1 Tax=Streptomyces sp. WP-1 TaxID=3041497 RepID=UPI00351B3DC0